VKFQLNNNLKTASAQLGQPAKSLNRTQKKYCKAKTKSWIAKVQSVKPKANRKRSEKIVEKVKNRKLQT